ncbi:pyruvate ferredoxin oxidoreductase [archaeon]|nr:MAG: pyruvate ferredoxin oxidoreductase [archaeon]
MTTAKVIGLRGDDAVAYAVKQCNVDCIAAYPITPQTIIVETLSKFVSNGEMNAKYINVESEHSAMSATIGACLAGGRVFTATASQGLALMHEVLYAASGLRCPIVLAVANRALSAPINIHCDHSDVMGSRDSGWVILFAENCQEAYDLTILAFKLAEDEDILLPVMVNLDGFILSHSLERVEVIPDEEVKRWLPPRQAKYKVDPKNPITFGVFSLFDSYFEIKRGQEEAMRMVLKKIPEIYDKFYELSGRQYSNLVKYKMDDAEHVIVVLGSTAGTARHAADRLREGGIKAGVLSLHLFRPFPTKEVQKSLSNTKTVTVMDRAISFGAQGGPLFEDIATALYDTPNRPLIASYIYGLGGRDITSRQIREAVRKSIQAQEEGKKIIRMGFIGVKGGE